MAVSCRAGREAAGEPVGIAVSGVCSPDIVEVVFVSVQVSLRIELWDIGSAVGCVWLLKSHK